MAGQTGPVDGVLTFLDVLLRRAALILECHHPLARSAENGDDEPDTGQQLAGVPRHLGHDAAGLVPVLGPVAEPTGSRSSTPTSNFQHRPRHPRETIPIR